MKIKQLILIVLLCCILLEKNASAWWSISVGDSTHYKLSSAAVNLAATGGGGFPYATYPDVTDRFGNNIRDWTSGKIDDQNAHNGDSARCGGNISEHWDLANRQYGKLNFNDGLSGSAYYYIALMTHLVEDMACPAHAYMIAHGTSLSTLDHMEALANDHFSFNSAGIVSTDDPIANYEEI